MVKKFYDTNAILKLGSKILDDEFIISSTTLYELENIKTNKNKDDEIKYNARKSIHLLNDNEQMFDVVILTNEIKNLLSQYEVEETPDTQIIACAKYYADNHSDDEIIFITNDICCKVIASNVFKLHTEVINEDIFEDYKGYVEKELNNEEMAYFYEHLNENIYDLNINEYLIIKDSTGKIVEKRKWTDNGYVPIKFSKMKSEYYGDVKPYNGDIYQQLALDSFANNQITMIKGAAGTGKSYLSLGYYLYLLEKHKIDKIIIFCNTVATANSAKLGFLPGTQTEKLLDASIGNMLAGKLGDKIAVERLVTENKLMLLPMCDIRGFDTNGMNCGVYITEAQNLDISLMKLALQRIGEDSYCIIDGDYNAQVDLSQYSGANNGMRRMSEVFRGQDFYGEVELQNIYRSKIANIAEQM